MAIYTPRGLKIRIKTDHAFALLARIYPQTSAFQVLKTTEGIELIPAFLGVVAGIVSFVFGASNLEILLLASAVTVIGSAMNMFGFFIPGIVWLTTIYSYLSGYGIYFISIVIIGLITVGWQGTACYFLGRLIGMGLSLLVGTINMKRVYNKTGIVLSQSEINFFNAYRIYARRQKTSENQTPSEEELQMNNWSPCLEHLVTNWPQVVARFTDD